MSAPATETISASDVKGETTPGIHHRIVQRENVSHIADLSGLHIRHRLATEIGGTLQAIMRHDGSVPARSLGRENCP